MPGDQFLPQAMHLFSQINPGAIVSENMIGHCHSLGKRQLGTHASGYLLVGPPAFFQPASASIS